MKKRAAAAFLAICLAVSLLPESAVFAAVITAETNGSGETSVETEEAGEAAGEASAASDDSGDVQPDLVSEDDSESGEVYDISDFIAWMQQRDDLTDEMTADLENAQEMLDGYVESGEILLDDETDGASLTNLQRAVAILQTIDELRQSDDNYNGTIYTVTPTLYTNFTFMVGSAYTANVSATSYAHVSSYSTFSNNENLAWGYTDPTDGWYTEEKELFDECRDELGYTAPISSSQLTEIKALASEKGYTIGHYTNLFYSVNQVMGVGYCTYTNKYASKTASANASSLTKNTANGYAAYTIDEFENYLYEYLVELYGGSGDCGDDDGASSISWSFDNTSQTLTISGTGVMADYEAKSAPWYYLARRIENVVVGDGVTNIGDYAFYECTGISSLTLAESVAEIGRSAFYYCTGLTEMELKEGLSTIGTMAFSFCTGLTELEFEEGLSTIGTRAFSYCSGLTQITFPASLTEIGKYAFYDCTALESLALPENLTTLGSFAFFGCSGLTEVVMAGGVETINTYTFYGCTALESVTFPGTLQTICSYAFGGCTALTDVYYVGSASTWSSNVTIDDGNDAIESAAFHYIVSIANTSIALSASSYTYDGTAKEPAVTVTYDGGTLTEGTDYTVEYSDNINAGTASVTVTGAGDCVSSQTVTFTIAAASISGAEVILAEDSYTYDGSEKTPDAAVTLNGSSLDADTDYTVSYSNNIDAGTAEVTVTGTGNYTDSASASFTIDPVSIASADVTLDYTNVTYSGSANEPAVTVTLEGSVLTEGTDYTVEYSDNINAGTAAVTVVGCGNYCSTVTQTYVIDAKSIDSAEAAFASEAYVYTGSAVEPVPEILLDGVSLTAGTDFTVSYENNTQIGTAEATVEGCGNYTGSISLTFAIKADIADAVLSIDDTESFVYDGTEKTPGVTVTLDDNALVEGEDYEVSYSDNTAIGTATVTITGTGNYTGTAEAAFTINPGKVTISSVSSAAAKKLTVKWKKLSGSVKYQIAYKKSSSSTWNYVNVGTTTLEKTLSSLSAGTTYNVKVRAYKKVGDITYKGEWSSTKSVKVKKAQTLTVKKATKTVSYSKVKKAKQTVKPITKVSGAKGTVTYTKSSGKSYFTVNKKTGKVTVKKGTPKGTYTVKIKVTSAATSTYAKATKTVSVKIKVK